jgi:hypothetical protein
MSDYLMFGKKRWQPRLIAHFSMFISDHLPAIDTPENLMEKISQVFPEVKWKKSMITLPEQLSIRAYHDPNTAIWFGSGNHGANPAFQVSADIDGFVKQFAIHKASKHQTRILEKRLSLISLNIEADSIIGNIFG